MKNLIFKTLIIVLSTNLFSSEKQNMENEVASLISLGNDFNKNLFSLDESRDKAVIEASNILEKIQPQNYKKDELIVVIKILADLAAYDPGNSTAQTAMMLVPILGKEEAYKLIKENDGFGFLSQKLKYVENESSN